MGDESKQNTETRETDTAGIEFELKSLILFLSRNLYAIILFGILGLATGLWLALSHGSLFHSYEIQVSISETTAFPSGVAKFYQKNGLTFDQETIKLVKPVILTAIPEVLPKNQETTVSATFVENTSPVLLKVSSSAPIDEKKMNVAAQEAFEKAFDQLKTTQGINEKMAKEVVLDLQKNLFRLYETQYQLLQSLKVKLPEMTAEIAGGETFIGIPQFASLMSISQVDDAEKRRIQSEYYDLEFQILKVMNNYRTFQRSSTYTSIIDRSFVRYSVDQIATSNTSGKEISRRVVVCLSGLFAGIIFGMLFCIMRDRLSVLQRWVRQLKS